MVRQCCTRHAIGPEPGFKAGGAGGRRAAPAASCMPRRGSPGPMTVASNSPFCPPLAPVISPALSVGCLGARARCPRQWGSPAALLLAAQAPGCCVQAGLLAMPPSAFSMQLHEAARVGNLDELRRLLQAAEPADLLATTANCPPPCTMRQLRGMWRQRRLYYRQRRRQPLSPVHRPTRPPFPMRLSRGMLMWCS